MRNTASVSGIIDRHKINRRRLGFEVLEERQLLAADVVFSMSAAVLAESGLAEDNPSLVISGADLSEAAPEDRTLYFSVIDDNTTPGFDYTSAFAFEVPPLNYTSSVSFDLLQAGLLSILDDSEIEGKEDFQLSISSTGSVLQVGSIGTLSVSIEDNDTAEVRIRSNQSVDESSGEQEIEVVLKTSDGNGGTATLGYGVTIEVELFDTGLGSAISGTDYSAFATQTITFSTGSGDGSVGSAIIDLVDNDIVNSDRSVVFDLIMISDDLGGNVSLGQAESIAIDNDDSALVSIEIAADEVDESIGNAIFTVSIDKQSDTPTVIRYSVGDFVEPNVDYLPVTGTVTIPAFASSATINIGIINDNVLEPDEFLFVDLEEITSGNPAIGIGDSTDEIEILDDDTALLSVIATIPNAAEPDEHGQFTVRLSNPSSTETRVYFEVSGTATRDRDYTITTGPVTLPAYALETTVAVNVLEDSILHEFKESVVLRLVELFGDQDIDFGASAATVWIADPIRYNFGGNLSANTANSNVIELDVSSDIVVKIAADTLEYTATGHLYGTRGVAATILPNRFGFEAGDEESASGNFSHSLVVTNDGSTISTSEPITDPFSAAVHAEHTYWFHPGVDTADASVSSAVTLASNSSPGFTFESNFDVSNSLNPNNGGNSYLVAGGTMHMFFSGHVDSNYSGVVSSSPFIEGVQDWVYLKSDVLVEENGFRQHHTSTQGFASGYWNWTPDLFVPHVILVNPKGRIHAVTTDELRISDADPGKWTIYVWKNGAYEVPTGDDFGRTYKRPYQLDVSVIKREVPLVVNIITHGWRSSKAAWNEYETILNDMPAPGSKFDGRVTTYVSDWDSDGTDPPLSDDPFTRGFLWLGASKLAAAVPLVRELLEGKAVAASLESARIAVDAAIRIADDVVEEYLLSPSSSNQTQHIQLIGHSRGAAVNALVSRLLKHKYEYDNIESFVSLDGFSTDWPDRGGLIGDISIVGNAVGAIKQNWRVEVGLAGIPTTGLSNLIIGELNSFAEWVGFGSLPLDYIEDILVPALGTSLFGDLRAPNRNGFINEIIYGQGDKSDSHHVNVSDLYFGKDFDPVYRNSTFLGIHRNDGLSSGIASSAGLVVEDHHESDSSLVSGLTGSSDAIRFGIVDGNFDETGILWNQAIALPENATGDVFVDFLVQSIKDPTKIIEDLWSVVGDASLVDISDDFAIEMNATSDGTSVSQFVLLAPQSSAVEFDLNVASASEDDVLSVFFENELLGEIQLSEVVGTRHSVPIPNSAEFSGQVSFVLGGAAGSTASITLDNLAIAVENNAPVLNLSQWELPAIPSDITEDMNQGRALSNLFGRIADSDPGSEKGIAIIGTNSEFGTVEYSLDDGNTWHDVGEVSDTNALLLGIHGSNRLRFVPSAGFSGTITDVFTFRAWDRTTGLSGFTGDYYDASQTGGSAPFSESVVSSSITVAAAGEYDTISNSVASFNEIAPIAGFLESFASGLSGNGSVVVGESISSHGDSLAFRWSDGGTIALDSITPPVDEVWSTATDITADGSVVAGWGYVIDGDDYYERGVIWDETHTSYLEGTGQFNSIVVNGVSDDGRVVLGYDLDGGFREVDGVRTPLPQVSGYDSWTPTDLSADGEIVVGYGYSDNTYSAIAWNGTAAPLGPGLAWSVSADGHTVVGESDGKAVYWRDGLMHTISPSGLAYAVSSDGEIIVGLMDGQAFIWSADTGSRPIIEILTNLGLDISAWELYEARDVSVHDGHVYVIGNGIKLDGIYRGWIVEMPLSEFVIEASESADFDNDGDVDGRDFLKWQRGQSSKPLSHSDLALWHEQYGENELLSVGGGLADAQELTIHGQSIEIYDIALTDSNISEDTDTAIYSNVLFPESRVEELDRALERFTPAPRSACGFGEMVARRPVPKRFVDAKF